MDAPTSQGGAEEAPPPVQDRAAETEPLAGDFPVPSVAEWEALVRAKAEDPERPLVTELEEGLRAHWLYVAQDVSVADPGGLPGAAPFTRGVRVGEPWAIRQRNATSDRRRANTEILEELEGGATEILLAIDSTGTRGIPVSGVEDLDAVLDGVLLDLAPVTLEGDPAAAELLLELLRRRGIDSAEARASLGLNPIGSEVPLEPVVSRLAEIRAEFPQVRVLAADTTAYADAGAGGVLELALALSAGVAYLRAGEGAGIDPSAVAAALEFRVAVGPDQFQEIARLRALRRLWSTVLEHCGVAPDARRSAVYAQTSRRMYSSLDPWVNLLRATTSAFAAALGGADGITVLPFDEPFGTGVTEAGPLGRRIARNTQLLLSEESSLHRVADPAGGSWYVESLTEQISHSAWTRFQALEASGGITAALADGSLGEELAASSRRRQQAIARRERSLTGVNQFPLLGDDGVDREAVAPPPVDRTGDGETVSGGARDAEVAADVDAVRDSTGDETATREAETDAERKARPAPGLVRDAAPFEALRARAADVAGARILLAATGPLAAHVNVAQWAKSFFEAGGIEAVTQTEDDLAPDGFHAAAVCVGTGSDPEPTLSALRTAGVETVYAVGADLDGVERVRDGVDMIAVLGTLLDRLEEAA